MTIPSDSINKSMRYSDLLVESVSDTRDIHLASQWIADGIIRHQIPIDKTFTVHSIFRLDGNDTLPIDYGPVSEMLLDDELAFILGTSTKSGKKPTTKGSFFPGKNLIWINNDLIRRGVASMASTIGHELRHALDFSLSKGKPFRKKTGKRLKGSPTDQYLRNPQEINARFTQAMWAMAFDTLEAQPKNAHAALAMIDDCLYRLHLDRAMFPSGPKGDKQFNRLRSRAISYWTQVARFLRSEEAEEMPKPTLMTKLKTFISRFKIS